MSDIIDRIDELVDEQMAAGEVRSDYLNDDPEYPRCPHCNRHWHGLRITQRIEDMRFRGRYDEDYSTATDDSAVLCEGSDFIGPQQAPASWSSSLGLMPGLQFLGFIDETPRRDISWSVTIGTNTPANRLQFSAYQYAWDQMQAVIYPQWTIYDADWNQLWRSEPEPVCTAPDGIEVEFGPQNWIHELTAPRLQFPRLHWYGDPTASAVAAAWDELTAPDYPIPVAPGIDTAVLEATMKAFDGTGPELPPLRQRGVR